MTFKTDAQADIAEIINDTDEFGLEAIHTPQGGSAQPAFNVILGESILHGNDDNDSSIEFESIFATAVTSDVVLVKKRDAIVINLIDYVVANDPYLDSEFSGTSVIEMNLKYPTKI